MLWIRLRYLMVTLAVGIASGGAGIYVLGSQELAPKDGKPVPKLPTTTTELTPPPKNSTNVTGESKAGTLQIRLQSAAICHTKGQGIV